MVFVYYKNKHDAEFSERNYKHAKIEVWIFENEKSEWYTYPTLQFEYQLHRKYDSDEDRIAKNGNWTSSNWYAESIYYCGGYDLGSLKRLTEFFKKMETYLNKIHNMGFKLENEEDAYYTRLCVIEKIGGLMTHEKADGSYYH
jgi:hypothetical protein